MSDTRISNPLHSPDLSPALSWKGGLGDTVQGCGQQSQHPNRPGVVTAALDPFLGLGAGLCLLMEGLGLVEKRSPEFFSKPAEWRGHGDLPGSAEA